MSKRLHKLFVINLLPFILSFSSCSSKEADTSEDSSNNESLISEESISEDSSENIPYISDLNPMNEPLIHNQYYLNHIGDIYNTWKSYQGHGITIAVIDVGFMADHPDFTYEDGSSKVSDKSAYFKTTGTTTSKQIGKEYLSIGYDEEYNNDHGTFCAGVAAAGINKKGVIGIAPLAELMLLRVDGHPYSINEAFKYASDNGAKVITISIGSFSDYVGDLYRYRNTHIDLSSVFNEAINYCRNKGTVVVSAGGNGGPSEANRPTEYDYPAATTGVIGVGGLASNKSDKLWTGSSYNSSNSYVFCDVFAPSEGMFGCCEYNSSKYDGDWKGTSFASPIVAGIAALYFEKYPNNTVEQFEEDLYASSHKFISEGLSINNIAHGRIDVGKLLNTTLNTNVEIKIKNTGSLNAYIWNSVTNIKEENWPGKTLNKDGQFYKCNVDTSKYDSIIFNDGSTQTIDIYASSFSYGNPYNLDVDYHDPFIGKYISINN